jgi:hypothetical protein
MVHKVEKRADGAAPGGGRIAQGIKGTFVENMDQDLDARRAFDGLHEALSAIQIEMLEGVEASGVISALREIDGVLRVIF